MSQAGGLVSPALPQAALWGSSFPSCALSRAPRERALDCESRASLAGIDELFPVCVRPAPADRRSRIGWARFWNSPGLRRTDQAGAAVAGSHLRGLRAAACHPAPRPRRPRSHRVHVQAPLRAVRRATPARPDFRRSPHALRCSWRALGQRPSRHECLPESSRVPTMPF